MYGIIDTNYSKEKHKGLAASWLEWEVRKLGGNLVPPEIADILLCTITSAQNISGLKRELKKYKKKSAKVILGGAGCYAPATFEKMVDCICVGEGRHFIRVLVNEGLDSAIKLPECYIDGEQKDVVPSTEFPWDCPPIRHPDGKIRVVGARGCKRKCLFCQTGWETNHRPNPDGDRLQRQIDRIQSSGQKLSVLINDGADDLKIKGQQEFASVTYVNLKKMMPISRQKIKSIRIGVEGVSERIRKAVKKPIDNHGLVDITKQLWRAGVGVTWFMIAGLPGETEQDWLEFREVIEQLKSESRGVVMIVFHAFIPHPAAPLSVLPLKDEYWEQFQSFRKWFFHGPGFTRRVQIMAPGQYKSRMSRACESMCASPGEIRRGWFEHENKNWRIKYLLTPNKMRSIALEYQELVKCV